MAEIITYKYGLGPDAFAVRKKYSTSAEAYELLKRMKQIARNKNIKPQNKYQAWLKYSVYIIVITKIDNYEIN